MPDLPADADPALLDREVRAELKGLTPDAAQFVGAHLVAAGLLVDDDPAAALAHARAARARAARLAAVREAVGVAAYHAGEWAESLAELRAARRMTGDPRWIAVMADCERALGRPLRAVKALEDPDLERLDDATRTEVRLVVAGARRDLGQLDAALALLERGGLESRRPGTARLRYAYADALAAAGRADESRRWFTAAAELDPDDETGARERLAGPDPAGGPNTD